MKIMSELKLITGGNEEVLSVEQCQDFPEVCEGEVHILPFPYPIPKPIGMPKPIGIDDDYAPEGDPIEISVEI